ncbi:MAG: hypothetical protein Q7R96_03370 [Nanoarchaeota archaeon]|nr:hypothetical protein [Nanoarchaeota archaeon]
MKFVIVLLGLLTILGGILPWLKDNNYLPDFMQGIPTAGTGYQAIIIVLGVIGILYGWRIGKSSALAR